MNLKMIKEFIEQHPNVKSLKCAEIELEFFEPRMPVQASTMPALNDMPPDDVMMFAATEDVEELMKQRKPE